MKNIKNLIIVSLVLFAFSSCGDDDNIFEFQGGVQTTDLVATLTTAQTVVSQNDVISFDYTLPQSFSNDAILQVRGTYGAATAITTDITVPSGQTTGSGTISLAGNDVGFGGEIYTISVSGIKLVEFQDVLDDDGNTVNIPLPVTSGDTFTMSSNELSVLVHQDFVPGITDILFGWDDGSDFDIRLRDPSGTLVDNSETGANPEHVAIDDSLADGTYTLSIVYWAIVDDSATYTFKVRNGVGETQIVTGMLSGYVADTAAEITVFNIVKSGSSYTITQI